MIINAKKKSKKEELNFTFDGPSIDKQLEDVDEQELVLYEAFLARVGDNVLMILPGTSKTKSNIAISRIIHGLNEPCAREKRADRFENCPRCSYWYENRTKREKGSKENIPSTPADRQKPKDVKIVQVLNITPFCEHKKIKTSDGFVEKLDSTEIDPKRVRKRPCFLDKETFDPESEKCKGCFAKYACFQGPQFLSMSKPRAKEMFTELKRFGGKKSVTINGKDIPIRGNVSLAWSILHGKTKIAERVAFPMIFSKVVDADKPKEFGTSYKVTFSRSAFVLPDDWQKRALKRARDITEYLKPISKKECATLLEAALKKETESDKPECFNDDEIKDTKRCSGEDCAYYDECCTKKEKKSKKKSKQAQAVEDLSDDDDEEDADAIIAKMKLGNKKKKKHHHSESDDE